MANSDNLGERAVRHSMVVPRGAGASGGSDVDPISVELFCPFAVEENPGVAVASRKSIEWALDCGLISEGPAVAKLETAGLARLEARAFPHAPQDLLELATVWVTLFCAIDDFVEGSRFGAMRLSSYLSRAAAAFRGEQNLELDALTRGFQDFGVKLRVLLEPPLASAFERELELLFTAYIWEEINRQNAAQPDYAGYRIMRVTTIGLRPQFLFSDATCPHGRRSEATQSTLDELERLTCRAVGWANDIFTYEKELELGEVHNLVAVLMKGNELPIREAVSRARAVHDEEVCAFLRLQAKLRTSAELSDSAEYRLQHLRHWIGGHLHWATQNGRYRPASNAA